MQGMFLLTQKDGQKIISKWMSRLLFFYLDKALLWSLYGEKKVEMQVEGALFERLWTLPFTEVKNHDIVLV